MQQSVYRMHMIKSMNHNSLSLASVPGHPVLCMFYLILRRRQIFVHRTGKAVAMMLPLAANGYNLANR